MSIILDALRRGRAKEMPGPSPNAAQTDAVLQTLGYKRFNPTAPGNRLKRVLGFLVVAILFASGLWAGVVWMTERSLWPARTRAGSTVPAPVATRAPAVATPPPQAAPTPADPQPVPTVVFRPLGASASAPAAPTATADRPVAPVATVTTGDDHFGRAVMYQRLGDFENALVSYRQVLQRDDLNVEAHNNLGVLYRDKGLFDDAIRHFQRAIAINPGYARARNNLGVAYLSQRKLDMAVAQFHAALAIDPKNVESMVNLSTVEQELGRRDQARPWLSRALEADSRNGEAHYNLGLLEDEAGNRVPALVHYRAFLQYGAAAHPTLVGDVRKRIAELEAAN